MINVTPTAERVESLVRARLGSDMPPVYWTAAQVPASELPDEFLVIEPLFATVNQSWNENTHAQHRVQVRACARVLGRATTLAQAVFDSLPATEFATLTVGAPIKVGQHYDVILSPTAHAVEKGN